MAESTKRDFTRRRDDGEPNPGGEYILTGSRFAYRNEKNVLVIHRTGDKVTLDDEQAQRLRAGKPGSPFQREQDVENVETEEVAVANEATYPAEEDGFQASPERTKNRRVPARRVVEPTPETDRSEDAEVPEPVTSAAATRPGAKK